MLRDLLPLFLILAWIPTASAQSAVDLRLSMTPASLALGPNETKQLEVQVDNPGTLAGDVSITPTAPLGWDVRITSGTWQFNLPAGQSRTLRLDVSPASRDPVPADGAYRLEAQIISSLGNRQDRSASSQLDYVAPAAVRPPPAVPAPPPSKVPYVVLGGAAAVVLGVYLWQARRVDLEVEGLREAVNRGTDALHALRVRNRGPWPQNVHLRLQNLPPGWYGALSTSYVRLDAGEAARIPMFLKVPSGASLGTGSNIRVQARANRYSPWAVGRPVPVTVVDLTPFRPAAEAPLVAVSPNSPSG